MQTPSGIFQIHKAHFSTDYSGIDHLYPPHFIWPEIPHKVFISEYLPNFFRQKSHMIYVHFPFCGKKCLFCRQFSIVPEDPGIYSQYEDALIEEIALYAQHLAHTNIVHLHFGGGTPTLFRLPRIVRAFKSRFSTSAALSINVEATPDSLNEEVLLGLKEMGATRLVIGVQSFDARVLREIKRPPLDPGRFEKLILFCRKLRIASVCIELIAGLPSQTEESFLQDIDAALGLGITSIRLYPLFVTPLTALWRDSFTSRGIGASDNTWRIFFAGAKRLQLKGWHDRHADFCLEDSELNPVHALARKGIPLLGMGISSITETYASHLAGGVTMLRYMNTLNLDTYFARIRRGEFPISSGWVLSPEESLRGYLVRATVRDGIIDAKKAGSFLRRKMGLDDLRRMFGREFKYLEQVARVDYNYDRDTAHLSLHPMAHLHARIFYSRKIMEECMRRIRQMSFQ